MRFDSYLFDMDGTLWDAVDSYAAIWNATIDQCCPRVRRVDYPRLCTMMGKPLEEIFELFIGHACPFDRFMEHLLANEALIMPARGGAVYPGVKETLETLSAQAPLFMVSNCTPDGLPNFLRYTGFGPYFTDCVSYGETGLEKDGNIRLMVERHALWAPLYIGDTAGDMKAAHAAGVPFAWATYGFGRGVEKPDFVLDNITDLLKLSKI